MKSMRQLINLMEGVVAVPQAGKWNAQTAPAVARPDPAIEAIKARAQEQSKGGYGVHVNRDKRSGNIYISDWYDSDETIASYSNGREVATYSEELEMAPQGSESDMQTASTSAVNSDDAGFDQSQGEATEESKSYDTWRNYTVTTTTGTHVVYGPADKDEMQAHLSRQYGGSGARIYGEVLDIEPYDGPVEASRDEKSARSYWDESVNEKAPPGMEDVVMDLKKEYPDDHSKAFATAWSIYNKKHGKTDESVPAVKSCQQSNPASADVACAMEDGNMSEYDNNFIGNAIRGLYQFATSEDELKSMVAGETGYGVNPDFDSVFSSELSKFLNTGSESEFGPEYGGEEFDENVDDAERMHGNALRKIETLIKQSGYKDGEIAAETGNDSGGDASSALDIFRAYQDAHPELMGNEQLFDRMSDAYDSAYEEGRMGLSEAFDIQNGYNDVENADGLDYFPDGADSPVTDKTGPSGARQGDNPEQKKMQIAEVHKELVYSYRNFLKESALVDQKKKLTESARVADIKVTELHENPYADVNDETITYDGSISLSATAVTKQGQPAEITYSVDVNAIAGLEWESDESPTGWNYKTDNPTYTSYEYATSGDISVTSVQFTDGAEYHVNNDAMELQEFYQHFDSAVLKQLLNSEIYVRALGPAFDSATENLEPPEPEYNEPERYDSRY